MAQPMIDLLHTLCRIAQAAGREIMDVYAGDFAVQHKGDESPLTEADLRADRVIRAGVEQAFPGVFIWSEESTSQAGTKAPDRFFLVDPLDGTKEFLKRNGEFTVNIALIESGVAVAGVVLAPALDELFYAAQGVGAFKAQADGSGARRLRCAAPLAGAVLRVIGSRSHGAAELEAWLAQLGCAYSFVAAGSSLKFCRIAEGLADVYPRFGPTSQWDTAAGQCVLECAGGSVLEAVHGRPLRYGLQRDVLNPFFIARSNRAPLP